MKAPLKRSAATEVFYGSANGKLIVVYHIQKTAGTSLRHVVRRNLGSAEVELQPGLAELRHERTELLDWYARWYGGLDEERRSRLCCVMSHLAGYLLPALDRPADALVLVREPVDRTLSYWHAKARRREGRKQMPSLEEIYAREPDPAKPERWEQFHNWQSRALLSVFHDVTELPLTADDPTAGDWRAKLRDLVGRGLHGRRPGPLRGVRRVAGGALRLDRLDPAEQGEPESAARRRSARRAHASGSWPRTGSTPSCTRP